MFKQILNECTLQLEIEPVDPILIKSGYETVEGPDMSFIQTYRRGKPEYYLPGSSLKGVLRSHSERIARTVMADRPNVCMPFARQGANGQIEPAGATLQDESCSSRFDGFPEELPPARIYQNSCPVCRLFGSTHMQGRFGCSDAYADGQMPIAEVRDGVGIDRFTGGASRGAKFNLQVITAGKFSCRLDLRNFELWQFGLLAYVLWDLKEANLWIGAGKSRGLGRVKGDVLEASLAYLGTNRPAPGHVWGVGSCWGTSEPYGFGFPDEVVAPGPYERQGLRSRLRLDSAEFWQLAEQAAERWNDFAAQYRRPDRIE